MGGKAVLWELSFDFPFQRHGVAGQFRQLLFIDVVHHIATCGQGDVHVVFVRYDFGVVSGVQKLEVGGRSCIVADVVEHSHEGRIALSVYLCQFNGHQFHFVEDSGREEIGRRVEAVQDFTLVALYDRLQLIDIAHQQHLLASERFAHVLGVDTQYLVDEVDDVGTYHRDFVDDDQLQLLDELAVL